MLISYSNSSLPRVYNRFGVGTVPYGANELTLDIIQMVFSSSSMIPHGKDVHEKPAALCRSERRVLVLLTRVTDPREISIESL